MSRTISQAKRIYSTFKIITMGKYKGVYWQPVAQKYKAAKTINGKTITLGYHKNAKKCFDLYHNPTFATRLPKLKSKIFNLMCDGQILTRQKTKGRTEIDRFEVSICNYNLTVILKIGKHASGYTITFFDNDMNRKMMKFQLDDIYEQLKIKQ